MYNYQIVFDKDWQNTVIVEGDDQDQDNDWFKILREGRVVFIAPYSKILYVLCNEKEKSPVVV